MWMSWISHTFQWKCKMVQALRKIIWQFLNGLRTVAIYPSNSTTEHFSHRREFIPMNWTQMFGTVICIDQKLETTKMSLSKCVIKQTVQYPNHGILLRWTTDTATTWVDHKSIILNEKNSISKDTMLLDFFYITFYKWQNYTDGKQISCCQGLKMMGRMGTRERIVVME